MSRDYPQPREDAVTRIVIGILLSIVTCGIYGLYWQYKQMRTLNTWLGREDFNFVLWLLLSIVTCGIFACYYEYKMAKGINEVQEKYGYTVNADIALICVIFAIFGLSVVSICIQQSEINKFYGETSDL